MEEGIRKDFFGEKKLDFFLSVITFILLVLSCCQDLVENFNNNYTFK